MATFFHATATIVGGSVNNTVIGNNVPEAGTFTTGVFNSSVESNIVDARTATALVLGGSTATSVTIGKSTTVALVAGRLNVKAGAASTNTGIDAATAGELAIGGTTATSVSVGKSGASTNVKGRLNVAPGAGSATIGIDTSAAGTLALGATTATKVEIAKASIDTEVRGPLKVSNIDTAAAGTIAIGGSTATKVELGRTDASTEVQGSLRVLQNVNVTGNLVVNGTTTTINTEDLNITDSHILLNNGYTVAAPREGGLIVANIPTATKTTVAAGGFVAAAGAVGPRVTCAAKPFAAGDIIMITGAANEENNGIFQYSSVTGTGPYVLEMRSNVGGTAPSTGAGFVQNNFKTDTTVAGTLTLVAVSVLQANSTGRWQAAAGSGAADFASYKTFVQGTGGSTDNAIARFDGTSGDLIQTSAVTIDDTTGIVDIKNANGNIKINGAEIFPTSSTDSALVRFSGTNGRAVKESQVVISDAGDIYGAGTLWSSASDLVVNSNYTFNTPTTGGLLVVYDPLSEKNAIAATGFSSATTVVTTHASTFAANEIINITGASNAENNGIYVVASYASGTITIQTAPALSFAKKAFIPSAGAAGTVTKTNVSHLRCETNGSWTVGRGKTSPLTYMPLTTSLSGAGIANRLTRWVGTNEIGASNVVVDASDNIDMNSASAKHIVRRSGILTLTASGAGSPSADADITFVSVDTTTCTGTLANGTMVGQEHIVVATSVGNNGKYNLTVTKLQPPGAVAGSFVLQFSVAGQSAHLVWNGTNWYIVNSGVVIL